MLVPPDVSSAVLDKRPLKTRVGSWACRRLLGCLSRAMILKDLEKIHERLPPSARGKFLEVLGCADNHILQSAVHPELFDEKGGLVFERVGERHVCKMLYRETLNKLVAAFGEVGGIRLRVVEGKALEIEFPRSLPAEEKPPAAVKPISPSVTSPDVAAQISFLETLLLTSHFPLSPSEIVDRAEGFSKRARDKLLSHLRRMLKDGLVLCTLDGRYMWADRSHGPLADALASGRISELYSDKNEPKEYVSSRGEEEISSAKDDKERIVRLQVGGKMHWTRFTFASELESKKQASRVYDFNPESGKKHYYYCLNEEAGALLQKGALLSAKAHGGDIFVAARACSIYHVEVYNACAVQIIRNLRFHREVKPEMLKNIHKFLDLAYQFVHKAVGADVFPQLERAVTTARIGGSPAEVAASLLSVIPRNKASHLLALARQRAILTDKNVDTIFRTVASFHLIRQIPFCANPDNPYRAQLNKRFLLKQTAGAPAVLLLCADYLEEIKAGRKVDAAKLEFFCLFLLDQTVQVAAASAMKDAILRRDHPDAAREIEEQICRLYGAKSLRSLEGMLLHRSAVLSKELRGVFGPRIKVIPRLKSLASIRDKIYVRRIYPGVEELWDIWGLQVLVESDTLAKDVTRYISAAYGENKRHSDPSYYLRRGDVQGRFGEGVDFYKVRAQFAASSGASRRAEIQVHTQFGFLQYKQGLAGTPIYNLQKKYAGLAFSPEPQADPNQPFNAQIAQIAGDDDRRECIIAGVDLSPEQMELTLSGQKSGHIRSVAADTPVIALSADPALQAGGKSFLARGYDHARVYSFALTNEWKLALVPALTDPKEKRIGRAFDPIADPDYFIEDGNVIVFYSPAKRNPTIEKKLAASVLPLTRSPHAQLELQKLLDESEAPFRAAMMRGKETLQKYLEGPSDRLFNLGQISHRLGFITLQDFFAALGYGFIEKHTVEADLKRFGIQFHVGSESGDMKNVEISAPDAFGLNLYLFNEVVPRAAILGAFSYTVQEESGKRAEILLQVSGKVVVGNVQDLHAFICREGSRAFRADTTTYIINVKRAARDWSRIKELAAFLQQHKVNVFEMHLSPGAADGYIKVELPSELSGAQFTRLLDRSPYRADEAGITLL
jgi:hypothetical protein